MAQITSSMRPRSYIFVNSNSITITHNLGYIPLVQIIVNGALVMGDVSHTSTDQLIVTFVNAISGTIYLR